MAKPLGVLGSGWVDRYIGAIQWFIPLDAQHDTAQLTRAQNVVNAVVMAALSGPLYALAYFQLGFHSAAYEILACCTFMFIAPFLLRATGSIVLAREVFLCAVFFNFTWLTYYLGGVNAPTVGWLITAPVVAMFLGGVGTALFWLAMSCAAVGVIYGLHVAGVPAPPHPVKDMQLLYLLCDIGLYVVVVVFVLLFELTKTQGFIKLEQALKIINELAIRDELTGSHNRRHLIKLIENEKERTARLGSLFCLCLLDIDYFKRINDTYGHSAGDTVLREFAATVQRQIRESDSFGRYGGEEFLLMLPETSIDEARALAERVRTQISKLAFSSLPDLSVTVSIGIAEFRTNESIAQTVGRADEALYLAKSNGRDQVVCYGQQDMPGLPDPRPISSLPPALIDAAGCDTLTGLLNRRMLRDRLRHAIERAVRNRNMVGLMLLNVNKFKEVNDAFGYEGGDAVLVHVGATTRAALRDCDTIARWSGDEFVVLLEDLSHESDAVQVAEKILDCFRLPFTVQDRACFVTLSIGIAVYPNGGADEDTLLSHADIAMTRAKSWGENMIQVYASEPQSAPNERLDLKNGLREALGGSQLFLEYQPQVDLASGAIVGVEALLRWQHPDLGRIEPGRFIPLAEETGMIVAIGGWVLRTACAQQRAWVAAGLPALKVAVNLSARQLKDPCLVASVLGTIADTGIDPHCLDLEVTESILIEDPAAHLATMTSLRALGVKISIDDFGTGYSSLNYLCELPADVLKIDGSFVRRLAQHASGSRSHVLVESVIDMAHRLNLRVIAEAVETADQVQELRTMGCDEAQGFYFNRPLHADRIAALLEQQQARIKAQGPLAA
ncbi:bifunctional diguanylate cyclase/phosphodiesterase [Massilia horti]|uniref:Diguanylate cyclase n=1 Tax=Massilia horti TaxID=2562153 RepID=A0A4Y9T825_9BURK|nr:diguanylate cyclase [Massilia horti]TFW34666.1 diguanylate cyclase [Massilia horti]